MGDIDESEQVSFRHRWVRCAFPCAAAAFFLHSVFRNELTSFSLCLYAFVLVWMLAAWLVVMRTRRPGQSFYAVGLASTMVGALFVVGPAVSGSPLTFGIVAWIGITALSAIWAVYYERTEPNQR